MTPKSLSPIRASALAFVALATGACDGVPSLSSARGGGDTVFVGVAVGLRTPERYADVFPGVQMALDELNASRPTGAPVLALRRARSGARSAVEVAAGFRDAPEVIGVVGHTESDATIDASPIYEDRANGGARALVAVSPVANGTMVTRLGDWVFRACPKIASTAQVLARFALDSLRVRRVAVIYRNDPMGKDFRRAFSAEFTRGGGEIVESDPFVEDIPEFSAYGARIVRRGVPAIAMAGNGPDLQRARLAARAGGGNPLMLSSNPPPADLASADHAGWYYLSIFSADRPPTPEGERFVEAFEQAQGHKPDLWSALSYDAAMLIGRAVHDVGPDRRRVRDWIAAVGRSKPAYVGVTGRIAFDEHGDPIDKPVLVRTESR
ncbi:MAG TPA: branched-chain amino acid ABC transporter substrate-binding protein [Gemmatimonadaceae bacterium]|nr:branched-chain amino acid ABC transporter substrate-binding protein [Gemmatimonadaceae bacterium]